MGKLFTRAARNALCIRRRFVRPLALGHSLIVSDVAVGGHTPRITLRRPPLELAFKYVTIAPSPLLGPVKVLFLPGARYSSGSAYVSATCRRPALEDDAV